MCVFGGLRELFVALGQMSFGLHFYTSNRRLFTLPGLWLLPKVILIFSLWFRRHSTECLPYLHPFLPGQQQLEPLASNMDSCNAAAASPPVQLFIYYIVSRTEWVYGE